MFGEKTPEGETHPKLFVDNRGGLTIKFETFLDSTIVQKQIKAAALADLRKAATEQAQKS